MARKSRGRLPQDLSRGLRRFSAFRRGGGRRRFPAELWSLAVGLAGGHGVHATAQALGLDYYSLKRRVEQAEGAERSAPSAFVELAPATQGGASEWVVEVRGRDGIRVRVELRGAGAAEIEALACLVSGVRG